jgi:hypothetical protein
MDLSPFPCRACSISYHISRLQAIDVKYKIRLILALGEGLCFIEIIHFIRHVINYKERVLTKFKRAQQ